MSAGQPASERRAPSPEAVRALREAAAALNVEEILDLCYAFAADPLRLRVYLEALRSKGSLKAQAGACLLCFDLARRGDVRAEQEFLALVPVIREYSVLAEDGSRPMQRLVEGSDYLVGLWSNLEQRLEAIDPRQESAEPEGLGDGDAAVEIDLFDDGEILELGLDDIEDVTASDALWQQWHVAVERLLSSEQTTARVAAGNTGVLARPALSAGSKDELARVEAFRQDALSLADLVDDARDVLPCVELFLAAHTRAKNLFGRRNARRDAMLEAGLRRFAALPEPPTRAFAWLQPPTGTPFAWDKVAEILLDFIAFLGSTPPDERSPEACARAYVTANRTQPPSPVLATGDQRRRR